jgi:surfeit locus 1 family protein
LDLLEYQRSRLKDGILPLDVALNSVDGGATQNNHPEKISDNSLQSLEYKRVQCEGVYDEDKSIFLGPRGRTKHGVTERGYYLITPLIPVESSSTM